MFTGLVEEMGKVKSLKKTSQGIKLEISCDKVITNAKIGDSIATNGVCLTVTELLSNSFIADVMNETVAVTTLQNLSCGDFVNLEKSLTLQSYLGGHLVTGDVDCCGKISTISQDGFSIRYTVEIDPYFMKYVVYKGRVALDGASLTVTHLDNTTFSVSIIPHTQKNITLGLKQKGDSINVETDLIGKHLEKLLNYKNDNIKKSNITTNFLSENGFF
ncbi:riboflavin synthase [uncultured Cetobacterium sp.]|uniref:riboflavin synthase n=2 Tax=uncultured Cetobacterium sp. TaxID=527638 RepID=UPI0026153B6F|nr:riboflavin synthase [uncultured Cetobacterium sp.]